MRRRTFLTAGAAMAAISLNGPAESMTTGQLARKSMLRLNNRAGGGERVLSMDDMQALPATEIVTETPWTDGEIRFSGVSLKDLVAAHGGQATKARATAFNDYSIEVDLADAIRHGAVVAYLRDSEPMSRRDKGPFWIVFPWSERPELSTNAVESLSIWQLVEIEFY
jgi:hypothetical protein